MPETMGGHHAPPGRHALLSPMYNYADDDTMGDCNDNVDDLIKNIENYVSAPHRVLVIDNVAMDMVSH